MFHRPECQLIFFHVPVVQASAGCEIISGIGAPEACTEIHVVFKSSVKTNKRNPKRLHIGKVYLQPSTSTYKKKRSQEIFTQATFTSDIFTRTVSHTATFTQGHPHTQTLSHTVILSQGHLHTRVVSHGCFHTKYHKCMKIETNQTVLNIFVRDNCGFFHALLTIVFDVQIFIQEKNMQLSIVLALLSLNIKASGLKRIMPYLLPRYHRNTEFFCAFKLANSFN